MFLKAILPVGIKLPKFDFILSFTVLINRFVDNKHFENNACEQSTLFYKCSFSNTRARPKRKDKG